MNGDVGDWQLRRVDPALTARYVADGYWTDESLGQFLSRNLAGRTDLVFSARSAVRPWRSSFADVDELARRIAAALRARGVGPGDRVAFQTPNWAEGAATFYAACYLGAVVVPIVHFYGPKEVEYILARSGVKVFVTADRFGSQDFIANREQWRDAAHTVECTVVIGERANVPDDCICFDDFVDVEPIAGPEPVDPDTPALIAYTSGTTSNPKGVVHSHRTITAEIRQLAPLQLPKELGGLPALTGAPIGHAIGMLAALLVPVQREEHIFLIDVWDPAQVLAAMLEDNVYAGSGSTYFVLSLIDHPDFGPEHLAKMKVIGLGGAAVPAAVAERLDAMGIGVFRSFGATEQPSITGCSHADARDKRLYTDGAPMAGVEVRLVDDDGRGVALGEPGEIWSRGPELFLGYTDPSLNADAFCDGWYKTGDVGVLDGDGFLTITDRKKDVIIRGGENVSPQEVEELIVRMPGAAEVAVVAKPHPTLGEVGCAFVRVLPGADEFTIADMQQQLVAAGIAKQKWPEDLRFVADFPRTPSGKVQKFKLREQLRAEARTTD